MPPRSREELLNRALALEGRALFDLARDVGFNLGELGLHGKGKIGALLERALGATGGSSATFDFPDLEVELKTVPLGENGRPRESTYVCTLQLLEADRAEWNTSWVRRKLSCVLFVPYDDGRVGRSTLFEPTEEDDAILKHDFDDIMGILGTGGIEGLTGHVGRALQVRPKAAHSLVRTKAIGPDDAIVSAVPRGFYLRAGFVGGILRRLR
jgi:DNA mismatch repair protein MutH